MRLFTRKMSPVQEAELQDYVQKLRLLRSQYEQAFEVLRSEDQDLYLICRVALIEDRDLKSTEYLVSIAVNKRQMQYVRSKPEKQVEINPLIEDSKKSLQKFNSFVMNMQAQIDSIPSAEWYPRKYKLAHSFLKMFAKDMIKYAGAATDALNSPDPLKHDPKHKNDKLDTFASSLNTIAVLSQRSLFPRSL